MLLAVVPLLQSFAAIGAENILVVSLPNPRQPLQVPEPTTLALFAIGFLCVIIARWRRHP